MRLLCKKIDSLSLLVFLNLPLFSPPFLPFFLYFSKTLFFCHALSFFHSLTLFLTLTHTLSPSLSSSLSHFSFLSLSHTPLFSLSLSLRSLSFNLCLLISVQIPPPKLHKSCTLEISPCCKSRT